MNIYFYVIIENLLFNIKISENCEFLVLSWTGEYKEFTIFDNDYKLNNYNWKQ